MRLERRRPEADEADEGGDGRYLHGPETEAARVEVRLDPIDDRIRSATVVRRREVLHHGRVGVHRRERRRSPSRHAA